MTTQILAGLSVLLLAAACSSDPETSVTSSGATATSATTGAATSGSASGGGNDTTVGSGGAGPSGSGATSTSSGSGSGGSSPSDLPSLAATSVCNALFRCCDSKSLADYFAPLAADARLAKFAASFPPNSTLASEAACSDLLTKVFAIAPFGDWVASADADRVSYLPDSAIACADTLAKATCGNSVTQALFDGTCFGFAAPAGGAAQRSMFARTAKAGASCAPIRDGLGSAFYGNCDPTAAFCCYSDPAKPNVCAMPFDAQGMPRAGTCESASALGETCDLLKDLKLCKTGDACDTMSGKCVASKEGPLALGAKCIDSSYNLLGNCVDSFCDVLGSKKCEPLKADGVTCNGYDQCSSGNCDAGKCAPSTFCKG